VTLNQLGAPVASAFDVGLPGISTDSVLHLFARRVGKIEITE
jgi:hypothetical protein